MIRRLLVGSATLSLALCLGCGSETPPQASGPAVVAPPVAQPAPGAPAPAAPAAGATNAQRLLGCWATPAVPPNFECYRADGHYQNARASGVHLTGRWLIDPATQNLLLTLNGTQYRYVITWTGPNSVRFQGSDGSDESFTRQANPEFPTYQP